MHNFSETLTI